ncbi:hypothetical protein [uncultured Methanobrevibacter sp.]|uniref:hypothetical protein n=1 Tax=uncultured Methanobrevibacter sp. TaxID=253161 RepID=UPI0025D6E44F|nr:hypothetical protein [uncultured Methanobrevibacter sp.]
MKIKIIKDNKAMIYSIDILITILILTVIIGIIFNMISVSKDKITDNIDLNKQETLSREVLDNLIKTEGTPPNWDKINYQNSFTPGLNSNEENNMQILSFSKIRALSQNYDILINNNILNGELKSQLNIIPLNNNLESITMGDNPNIEASNVVIVNRSVKIDYLSEYSILNLSTNNTNNYICPDSHDDNWICNSFGVYYNLNQYDYYLLSSSNNFQYKLSNGINSTILKSSSNGCVKLNSDIQSLNENKNSPIIVHIIKNNNPLEAKVVVIDKNTDRTYLKYDYFKSQDAYIIFKTWYN